MPAKAMPARQLPQWDPLVGVAQESLTGVACQRHRGILDELTKRNVKLSLGGSIHDPTDPVGRLLFNVLAMA
jgi:hypothetical protein